MTTTPPKRLDGLGWNFKGIFLYVSSCASDKKILALRQPSLAHTTFSVVGNKNRSVGPTNMNAHSSRSHAIFTITIECSEKTPDNTKHFRLLILSIYLSTYITIYLSIYLSIYLFIYLSINLSFFFWGMICLQTLPLHCIG